uniref:Uncharacterized protein n=1 Tax=Caenorhabditis japonica TaxID=281687 RepID=A0A8R1I4R9_CAEJA
MLPSSITHSPTTLDTASQPIIQCCYTREKMLKLSSSPMCLLRPAHFHSVVRQLPELLRDAPAPEDGLIATCPLIDH